MVGLHPSMADDSGLSQIFVDWLDGHGMTYPSAHARLCGYFRVRGAWDSELDDLASEVVWRAAGKLQEGMLQGEGFAALAGIANYVFLEWIKKSRRTVGMPDTFDPEDPSPKPDQNILREESHWAVHQCRKAVLTEEDGKLLLRYHEAVQEGECDELARELKIDVNALRVRIHTYIGRIRACIHCIDRLTLQDRAVLIEDENPKTVKREEIARTAEAAKAVREKLCRCSRKTLTYAILVKPCTNGCEERHTYPRAAKKLKLLFAISRLTSDSSYRVVLADETGSLAEDDGLRATKADSLVAVQVQLGVNQARGRHFHARIYAEVSPELELHEYRFTLTQNN